MDNSPLSWVDPWGRGLYRAGQAYQEPSRSNYSLEELANATEADIFGPPHFIDTRTGYDPLASGDGTSSQGLGVDLAMLAIGMAIVDPFLEVALPALEESLAASRLGRCATETTASPWVMGSYREMQAITAGQRGAIQAHHILEERHLLNWGLDASEAPAVVLSREEHAAVTSLLRQELSYGRVYSPDEVWSAYQRVYAGAPEWLDAVSAYFKKP